MPLGHLVPNLSPKPRSLAKLSHFIQKSFTESFQKTKEEREERGSKEKKEKKKGQTTSTSFLSSFSSFSSFLPSFSAFLSSHLLPFLLLSSCRLICLSLWFRAELIGTTSIYLSNSLAAAAVPFTNRLSCCILKQ